MAIRTRMISRVFVLITATVSVSRVRTYARHADSCWCRSAFKLDEHVPPDPGARGRLESPDPERHCGVLSLERPLGRSDQEHSSIECRIGVAPGEGSKIQARASEPEACRVGYLTRQHRNHRVRLL